MPWGLTRLWLVPDGASPADGAYLIYPLDDLLRLTKLESHRHRAIVIGEDLGTVPEGFREKLDAAGIAGMRVLWFERDEDGFVPPGAWPRRAVAMTSTHDLPTVAGWWRGVDIDARDGARPVRAGDRRADATASARDRSRAVVGRFSGPPAPRPLRRTCRMIRRRPSMPPSVSLPIRRRSLCWCRWKMPLGLDEQPNLPGALDHYPSWRQRYAPAADEIFDDPAVRARARWLSRRSAS